MKTEIIVALIACVTSVLVAVVTIIMSFISVRHSSRSMKEIEKLKFELTQISAVKTESNKYIDEALKGLQIAIQAIQEVKDEIQLALSAKEIDIDSESSIERIKSARERMFKYYEEHLAILDEEESRLFHRAKNISVSILGWVTIAYKKASDEASNYSETKLVELRSELSDIQQRLRDRRSEIIIKKLGIVPPPVENIQPASPQNLSTAQDTNLPDDSESFPTLLKGVKVLVVDDDDDVCEVTRLILAHNGADVTTCTSVSEAMKEIERRRFDILLSDISLPVEDGYSFINRVRNLNSDYAGKLPAIALTAFDNEVDKRKILSAGFQKHIAKPFDPNDLVNAIAELVVRDI